MYFGRDLLSSIDEIPISYLVIYAGRSISAALSDGEDAEVGPPLPRGRLAATLADHVHAPLQATATVADHVHAPLKATATVAGRVHAPLQATATVAGHVLPPLPAAPFGAIGGQLQNLFPLPMLPPSMPGPVPFPGYPYMPFGALPMLNGNPSFTIVWELRAPASDLERWAPEEREEGVSGC